MKSTALKADREYWNIETLDIVKALQPSYMSLLPIYTITLFALFVCLKIKKSACYCLINCGTYIELLKKQIEIFLSTSPISEYFVL